MEKVNIVGVALTRFKTKDNVEISGKTIHVTEPIPKDRGQGCSTDHFFLSDARLSALPFQVAVGQTVTPLYSRFGKVVSLILEDEEVDIE